MTGQELSRWADSAMYPSEPMPEGGPGPRVILLNATPDPLGSVAALCFAYTGRVVRDRSELTDDERQSAFQDMMKTVLNGPLEAAQFHFLLEGVSRALVDQLTRGRAAFYAVESLRFAVKESDWINEIPVPPSIQSYGHKLLWERALETAQECYAELVESGVPAEDARRLVPIGIATRAHWVVDLRELLAVAGKRLCTQAEFEWRQVFALVVKALRDCEMKRANGTYIAKTRINTKAPHHDGWQFALIADVMRPVCYQQGKCGFMANFDRGCTIRGRVDAFAKLGVPSDNWDRPSWAEDTKGVPLVDGIKPEEWALDPTAARRRTE